MIGQVEAVLGGLARELGSWELGPVLAWAYLHTDEHLAQLAEQLTALAPPQLELQLLAEAGDSRQLDLGSAGAGGVAGGVVQQLTSSLGEYSARHCPDTRYQDISTVYLGLSIHLCTQDGGGVCGPVPGSPQHTRRGGGAAARPA